jgi:PAS domain S-box-containing protein
MMRMTGFLPTSTSPLAVKIMVVAAAYFLTGQLGLLLAVPPGYATVIWPASGLAVGALLAHGPRLWPGVFVGSFVLNAMIGGAYTDESGWLSDKLVVAAAIAAGSTAQALTARWLVARSVGVPIDLRGPRDLLLLFLLAAPASCLIAPTVGAASLYASGALAFDALARNWLTWWTGDVFGLVIFLPLVLVAPGAKNRLFWRGAPLGSLPIAALLVLLLPLGLTFYGWKVSSQFIYDRNKAAFEALAQENEHALLHRLSSYNQGLLGAVGFIKGSDYVSAGEWRSYIEALDVGRSYPGVSGIGFIKKVDPSELAGFVAQVREERPEFTIHPETPGRPNFVIDYVEPHAANAPSVGLNIAFEDNRMQAALLAQDSGRAAITKPIVLVQDRTKSNGFLLLHPMYRTGSPAATVEQRRAALIGWVYAPFIASNFMAGLTVSQSDSLHLQVFDGESPDLGVQIYDSGRREQAAASVAFKNSKTFDVMQRRWTVVWSSTPNFERNVRTGEPMLVLVGGLIFTGLFGALLFVFAHRAQTVEKLVDEKTRELSERESLYRLLAENTSDMISRVGLDGTRFYISPACKKLLGYAPEELYLTNAMSEVRPDQRPLVEAEYGKLARGEIDESKSVFALQRKDGGWIEVDIECQLVRDRQRRPVEVVVTKRDVTLRERRAEELRLAKEEAELAKAKAEQANEAKTAFLATMSHEIRTPLNGIIGYTDFLLAAKDLSDTNRRYAERISTSGAALLTVVNDILDFSRIEAGQVELDSHPFSLRALVDNAMSIVGGAAARKGLHMAADLPAGLPDRLTGDEDRLRQILLNLLNNAVKFTAKGSVHLHVERMEGMSADVGLRFTVRDTGLGIAPEQQDRLFQRFSQVDGSVRRMFGGSGLGLAISKHLVELMGGRIGVSSAPNVGSAFWFEVALPEAAEAAEAAWDARVEVASGRARILLVEDVEVNQDIASAVLRNAGHHVDIVSDGADAVAAVQAETYDLVLMDVQMPGMDGITAARLIRALPAPACDVPIVALTANVLPFQIAELRQAGMVGHVGKPFRQHELLGAVARLAPRSGEDARSEAAAEGVERSAAAPAIGAGGFNRDVYAALEDAIGSDKAYQLLDKLTNELKLRLVGGWLDAQERAVLRSDAHRLIASTAMFGFEDLSEVCREIEAACDAGENLSALMQRYGELRRGALARIEALKSVA